MDFSEQVRETLARDPGVGICAVDPATGAVLQPGEEDMLEARIRERGPDWIRTTDLVMIDSDGFAFHRGRHGGVTGAAVVGLSDARLGQVPAAAVESRPGSLAPSAKALEAHVRGHLTAPHMPVKFLTVESLPRIPSMKISLTEVRRLLEVPA